MKTDSLFYQLFSAFPSLLFELIGNPSPRNSTYGFASQEVKQTSFRMDGILLPPPYASDLPIYFVEVQGYKDKKGDLYPGFFGEIFLYLNDYRPPNDRSKSQVTSHKFKMVSSPWTKQVTSHKFKMV